MPSLDPNSTHIPLSAAVARPRTTFIRHHALSHHRRSLSRTALTLRISSHSRTTLSHLRYRATLFRITIGSCQTESAATLVPLSTTGASKAIKQISLVSQLQAVKPNQKPLSYHYLAMSNFISEEVIKHFLCILHPWHTIKWGLEQSITIGAFPWFL